MGGPISGRETAEMTAVRNFIKKEARLNGVSPEEGALLNLIFTYFQALVLPFHWASADGKSVRNNSQPILTILETRGLDRDHTALIRIRELAKMSKEEFSRLIQPKETQENPA